MDNTTPRALGFPLPDVHAVDFGMYDEASNRVPCGRCLRMIDANAWAKPCPGVQSVYFDHIFKRGEGQARASECDRDSRRSCPTPSLPESHEENGR